MVPHNDKFRLKPPKLFPKKRKIPTSLWISFFMHIAKKPYIITFTDNDFMVCE